MWQCRRTASLCEELKADGEFSAYVQEHTGLLIDAYFSATKLKWILDHVEGAREKAERGELLFGTVDAWLVWKLTGGAVHITDVTNASRTMLFDIRRLCWDEHICARLGIPMKMLPQVRDSSQIYGTADLLDRRSAGGKGPHRRGGRGPAGRPVRPGLLRPGGG